LQVASVTSPHFICVFKKFTGFAIFLNTFILIQQDPLLINEISHEIKDNKNQKFFLTLLQPKIKIKDNL